MKTIYAVSLVAALAVLMMASGVPVYASDMDDRIETAAKESYVFKTFLKDDDIEVESRGGVVTLTGTVADESHKSLARETVAGLPGVKDVDNRLEVKTDKPAEGSDAWIGAKIKLTLLFHRNVSAARTEVVVEDGVVTLRGNADSEAQKELTAEYVKDVGGVKNVINEMTVSALAESAPKTVGEKIDDASITAQVKMALLLHRSTSALGTSVETNNGVVTVSGKAKNAAEKDLVTKLASDITGVESVNNLMTVEGAE